MSSNESPLSNIAAEVAEYFAAIHPERPARSKVMKWAGQVRRTLGAGRGFQQEEFKAAIEELVAAGLLQPSIEGSRGVTARGPCAMPGTLTRFCEAAVKRGAASLMIDMVEEETYRSYYHYAHEDPFLEQRVRVALIQDMFYEYEDMPIPPSCFSWLTEPAAKPYLNRLNYPHLPNACLHGIQWLRQHLQPVDVFAKTAKSVCDDPSIDVVLASTRLFEGELKAARTHSKQVQKSAIR